MKPSDLVLTDFVMELYVCWPSGLWFTEYRTVRAYDAAEAHERMQDYCKLEGFPVFTVSRKL